MCGGGGCEVRCCFLGRGVWGGIVVLGGLLFWVLLLNKFRELFFVRACFF